jgi:hypothetical protein
LSCGLPPSGRVPSFAIRNPQSEIPHPTSHISNLQSTIFQMIH